MTAALWQHRFRRWLLPWGMALAALANMAYPMYQHYDFSHSLDSRGYLRMATGRFDSVSITRRYRVLVPAAAGAVALPVSKVYGRIWPQRPAGQWPLRFAFYLVNCLLLAGAGVLWFNGARLAGASAEAAAIALLAVLSSRWAAYAAGLPLTDSLYLLVFGLGYYAFRRGTGAGWALATALLVGPLAKESFVFLLPWLAWYGRRALSWPRQLLALAIGTGALLLVHHLIDARLATPATASVSNALDHLQNITLSLHRAASPKGLGELLSVFGFFTLVPIGVWLLARRYHTSPSLESIGWAESSLLVVVSIHMLLSGDLGRMAYLAAPVFTVMFASSLTRGCVMLRSW